LRGDVPQEGITLLDIRGTDPQAKGKAIKAPSPVGFENFLCRSG
ncbi:hypothetical protein L195_g062983, partial [Trifolium pratense]